MRNYQWVKWTNIFNTIKKNILYLYNYPKNLIQSAKIIFVHPKCRISLYEIIGITLLLPGKFLNLIFFSSFLDCSRFKKEAKRFRVNIIAIRNLKAITLGRAITTSNFAIINRLLRILGEPILFLPTNWSILNSPF